MKKLGYSLLLLFLGTSIGCRPIYIPRYTKQAKLSQKFEMDIETLWKFCTSWAEQEEHQLVYANKEQKSLLYRTTAANNEFLYVNLMLEPIGNEEQNLRVLPKELRFSSPSEKKLEDVMIYPASFSTDDFFQDFQSFIQKNSKR